jgi:hypothetical protein
MYHKFTLHSRETLKLLRKLTLLCPSYHAFFHYTIISKYGYTAQAILHSVLIAVR